jgi:hypothetical protein
MNTISNKPTVSIISLIKQDAPYLRSYFSQIESLSERFCIIKSINLVHDNLRDGALSPLLASKQEDQRIRLIPESLSEGIIQTLEEKTLQWATIGNQGIEKALEAESDYILWVEADLCFPYDLLDQLVSLNLDIISPLVYLGINFYDSWGFRDLDGNKIYEFPPKPGKGFFDGPVELSSVGSCVLFRSEIFKKGVRFRGPYETGLLSGVCADARKLGFQVWADPSTCIIHPTSSWRSQVWVISELRIDFPNGDTLSFNFFRIVSGLYHSWLPEFLEWATPQIEELQSVTYQAEYSADPKTRLLKVLITVSGEALA